MRRGAVSGQAVSPKPKQEPPRRLPSPAKLGRLWTPRCNAFTMARTRLLTCEDGEPPFTLAELPADVLLAREAYRAEYLGRLRSAKAGGAVEDDGGFVGVGRHVEVPPWWHFARSPRRA